MRLNGKLESQLGGDFGGSWFDRQSGKLVVAVSSAQRAAEVRAAGAEAKVVSRSQHELENIKGQLDGRAATNKTSMSGVTAWRVDPLTNAVVVTVQKGTAPAALTSLRKYGDAVRIETSVAAPSTASQWLQGGDAYSMSNGSGCSTGFNAVNAWGTRYVVTAGHCGAQGVSVSRNGLSVGVVEQSNFGPNDYAAIRVDNTTDWALGPDVNAYDGTGGRYIVHNWYLTAPPVGTMVCKSGVTTGVNCGEVTGVDETVNVSVPGAVVTVYGLTRNNTCVEHGDSGGSNLSWTNEGFAMAEGVTSAASLVGDTYCIGNTTGNYRDNISWFQPIGAALAAYSLSLITG